jgi:branched-chain amino acid transport system permease protein
MDLNMIIQVGLSGLAMGGVYSMVAFGFHICHRITRAVNFGQGDFLMVASFITLMFIRMGIPSIFVFILVVIAMAILGIILEKVTIRPVLGAGLSYVLTTMGFGMILENAVSAIWGGSAQPFPFFFGGMRGKIISLAGINVYPEEIIIILFSLFIMFFFFVLLNKTMMGKAFSAVAHNRDTALILGIDVKMISVITFVIASVLAGISGFLVGPLVSVEPFMGLKFAIKGFIAAILGGLLNPVGILVGSSLLGLIENYTNLITSQFGDMISFITVIIVLTFRPSGLFEKMEGREEENAVF